MVGRFVLTIGFFPCAVFRVFHGVCLCWSRSTHAPNMAPKAKHESPNPINVIQKITSAPAFVERTQMTPKCDSSLTITQPRNPRTDSCTTTMANPNAPNAFIFISFLLWSESFVNTPRAQGRDA